MQHQGTRNNGEPSPSPPEEQEEGAEFLGPSESRIVGQGLPPSDQTYWKPENEGAQTYSAHGGAQSRAEEKGEGRQSWEVLAKSPPHHHATGSNGEPSGRLH